MENNEYFASINEVSKRLGVPAHTLRYWEKQFPVIIRPTTGAGGRRYYREQTVQRLMVIKDLLYSRGMTIAGVKKLLRDGALPDSVDASPLTFGTKDGTTATSTSGNDNIELAISLLNTAREILTVGEA